MSVTPRRPRGLLSMRWILCVLLALGGLLQNAVAVPQVDGKSFDELVEDAASEEARARRVAVGRLAKYGTQQAWELVVAALADEEPEVADQAQLDLAKLPQEHAELLDDKAASGSKTRLVRERVAELLGRAEFEVDPGLLEDLVTDREAPVRRMACWSAERLEGREHWDTDVEAIRGARPFVKLVAALDKAARRDRDLGVRAAALQGLHALEAPVAREAWLTAGTRTPAVELALEFMREKEPELRVAGLLLVSSGAREPAALGALGPLVAQVGTHLEDDEPTVRRAAIEALARLRSKSAMEALVQRLGKEEVVVLADLLLERLRGVTGRRHGADPRPWLAWLGEQPNDWIGASEDKLLSGGPMDAGETVVRLAGLPITSRNIAFLIDMSGSMWDEDASGRTLKERVDVELAKCLEALPDGAQFLLVPYATEPGPYEDGAVKVSSRSVKKALEWFGKNRLRGRGNVWDAFAAARDLGEFDTVVIFTDGAPTGGPHWNMGLMVELLLESTRFEPVTFHSILTNPGSGRLQAYWKDLSTRSGGQSLVVDLSQVEQK